MEPENFEMAMWLLKESVDWSMMDAITRLRWGGTKEYRSDGGPMAYAGQ
jgi:hypothetical protein